PVPCANPVRKNQNALTARQRRDFVRAVWRLKTTVRPGRSLSIYDEYVLLHVMAMHEAGIHEGPAFFPWHRKFLRNFELELQAAARKVTLPYWDFPTDHRPPSPPWHPDFLGGNGDPRQDDAVTDGPFRRGEWHLVIDGPFLRREFGGPLGVSLP